jgi:hypothetical protein
LKEKVAAQVYETEITAVGNRRADHATPLYSQKLALTLPTSGGRSAGIVRLRTEVKKLLLLLLLLLFQKTETWAGARTHALTHTSLKTCKSIKLSILVQRQYYLTDMSGLTAI